MTGKHVFCFFTLPAVLVVQEAWHRMRLMVIGNAVLLLGLCVWLFYILPKQAQDKNQATDMPQEEPPPAPILGTVFVSHQQSRTPS